ncbi:unnamed protein product, partial [Symbiodinium necroappetens]
MDTSARDKKAETEDNHEEPPAKWQKATGKGAGSKDSEFDSKKEKELMKELVIMVLRDLEEPEGEEDTASTGQWATYLTQIKQNLIFPKVVLRFHALRRQTSNMTSAIVSFTLEIHNRCQEGQTAYLALE